MRAVYSLVRESFVLGETERLQDQQYAKDNRNYINWRRYRCSSHADKLRPLKQNPRASDDAQAHSMSKG